MIYRLSLSTYVNTLLLNKAQVVSNWPGPTDGQTPLTYMYRLGTYRLYWGALVMKVNFWDIGHILGIYWLNLGYPDI